MARSTNYNKNSDNSKGKGKRSRERGNVAETSAKTKGKDNISSKVNSTGLENVEVYMSDPELTRTVANLSFGNRLGSIVQSFQKGEGAFTWKLPGIMAVRIAPSIGYTSNASDPANVAARRMYAVLTHGTGRSAKYTPPDVMQVELAYAEVIKMFSYAVRTLQLSFNVNPLSAYEPEDLVLMSGFDPNDINDNRHDYIGTLQELITMSSRIVMPGNLNIFKQAWNQFAYVYADSPDAMSQVYIPVPEVTWKYTEGASAPTLRTVKVYYGGNEAAKGHKFKELLDLIRSMINDLYASEACQNIMADVINVLVAQKGVSSFVIPQITTDNIISGAPRICSDAFNLMLRNATVLGLPSDLNGLNVTQDAKTALIKFNPVWEYSAPILDMDRILSSVQGPLDQEGVVIATRWTVATNETVSTGSTFTTTSAIYLPNLLVIGLDMMAEPEYTAGTSANVTSVSTPYLAYQHNTADTAAEMIIKMSRYVNFLNAPRLATISLGVKSGGTNWSGLGYAQDLAFYTTIKASDLQRIHTASLLSLFDFNYTA